MNTYKNIAAITDSFILLKKCCYSEDPKLFSVVKLYNEFQPQSVYKKWTNLPICESEDSALNLHSF